MSKKVQAWVVGIGILIILILPILFEYIAKKRIDVISFSNYVEMVNSQEFSLVYFGNTDSNEYLETQSMLSAAKIEYDINIVAVNYSKLSAANLAEIKETFTSKEAFVFIKDQKVVYILEGKTTAAKLDVLIDKYYNGIIPDEEIYYKSLNTYDEFMGIVNSKNTTMFVFGRDNCPFCNKFKPIYNEVAGEYKIDIYFINTLVINKAELEKILNSGLKIPAACSKSNKEELLSEISAVPLTIFTKSNKTVGCLDGFVDRENLLNKLKTVGMIK